MFFLIAVSDDCCHPHRMHNLNRQGFLKYYYKGLYILAYFCVNITLLMFLFIIHWPLLCTVLGKLGLKAQKCLSL